MSFLNGRFPLKVILILLSVLTLMGSLTSCGSSPKTPRANPGAKDIKKAQDSDSKLTLDAVTLEQVNEKGQKVWVVKSQETSYSKEKSKVDIKKPTGFLYQDGKELYQVQAKSGYVDPDGNTIFLKDDIVATDPKNGIVLHGEELEWRPKEDILIVRKNLRGEHKQLNAIAKEARVFSRQKRMDLIGDVIVTLKEPVAKLHTQYVIWMMEQQKISSLLSPVKIERYSKDNKVSDSGFADQGDVELKTKIVTLSRNAQILMSDPPLQIESKILSWSLPYQLILAPEKVTVLQREEKVTMMGNQGRGDMANNIFYLTGNVIAIGEKRNSQLNSDKVTWYVKTQTFDAEGNIFYQQLDPAFNLTGPKASGQLKDQTVIVTGDGRGGQVVTEIDADSMKKEVNGENKKSEN
jgi:LPS export ABC transporter protein LptC